MKNLKFRIWDKQLKVFLYQLPEKHHLEWERFDTQQWTGLFDKLGKEIYEGDVVGVKELRWIVNLGWSGDGEYGVCQKSNYGNHIFRDVDKVSERYEIIGNIYEKIL